MSFCTECGHKIPDDAAACPQCGHSTHQPVARHDASGASSPAGTPAAPTGYADYQNVPWYRRSSWNTFFIIAGFATKGYIPLVLVTCILVLTGDIYFNERDAEGRLKTWGRGNRYIAVFLLVMNALILFFFLLGGA